MQHPDLFRLALLWSPVRPDAVVIEASVTALSRLALRLERAQAAGLLPDRSSRELALELARESNGLAGLEFWGTPGVAYEHIWNDTVGAILRGLCTDAASTTNRRAYDMSVVARQFSNPKECWGGWSGGARHARTRISVGGVCCRLSSI